MNLIEASRSGDLERVKELVEQGANIHAWNDLALRCASENGDLEVVKFLVENGADNINDALIYASGEEVIKFLVEKGADIHARANNNF